MTPFIKAIAQYIADNTSLTFGSGNVDIKIGEMPRDIDGVYLIDDPAQEPDRYTPIKYAQISFWARYRNTATAYANLSEIYGKLDRNYAFEVGDEDGLYLVEFSHCLGGIEDQDRDLEEGKLLRLSVYFIYRPLDSVS